ncbi:MAG: exodeoxyribonuclease VII large subunit [Lachnospiraceae bacterium]|nr:exodeoxyribonuclease VII large subunit [Lachnospiraceae bacterium]
MRRVKVYTVGQINHYIHGMVAQDVLLSSLFVRGEVSNCKYHSSGHIYFSLKDREGSMACVMFAGNRRGLTFPMKDGDRVVVGGTVDVYEKYGTYQLYAREIVKEGAGALYEKYMALRKELEEEGMFDPAYKKPIPRYAKRIGVVTAPTGAAIRDIQNIARRRNPFVDILLAPALVQGDGAKESIVKGIERLDAMGLDILIVGRGGGSIEDLWAFNEPEVARAIFACATPVISAVGHEVDTTIADYVADLRAPTPSAAAEIAVFDYSEFMRTIENGRNTLGRAMEMKLVRARNREKSYEACLTRMSPMSRLRDQRMEYAEKMDALTEAMERKLSVARTRLDGEKIIGDLMVRKMDRMYHRLDILVERMKGLNPLDRLREGYAYVSTEHGRAVTQVDQVKAGDMVTIHVTDGSIRAEVRDRRKDGGGN